MSAKLEWPRDAVMIVAADEGEEKRDQMEGRVHCVCTKCKRDLIADTKTIRVAALLPSLKGRPIRFFCVLCALLHKLPPELHDLRKAYKVHGCKDCGEERVPRVFPGGMGCPECGSTNIVPIE